MPTFGITYLEGKIQFKLLFQGPMAKWGMNIYNSPENWRMSPWKGSILKGNYSISSNYQFSGDMLVFTDIFLRMIICIYMSISM